MFSNEMYSPREIARAAGVNDLHDGDRFAFVKIRLGVCMRDRHA